MIRLHTIGPIVSWLALVVFATCGCRDGVNPNSGTDTDSDTDTDDDTDSYIDDVPPGHLLWAQHLGGPDFVSSFGAWILGNQGHSVSALSDGTFCAGGSFVGDAVFGVGTSNPVAAQTAGGTWDADAFIGRWSPGGAPSWVLSIGGDESSESADGFAELGTLPGDSVMAIARLENGANLDPLGDAPVTLDDENSSVAPVYGADGRFVQFIDWIGGGEVWTHGASYSQDLRLRAASDGSVIISTVAHGANGPVVLGEGEPNETTLTPDPDSLFWSIIAKYAPDGLLDWAVKLENGSHELDLNVNEIAIGPSGEVVAAGYFGAGILGAEALVFGTDGEFVSLHFTDDPEVDETASFLAKWSPVGIVEWVKQIPPVYGSAPLYFKDETTITLMSPYLDGVTFDPGGPGEAVIDHGPCTTQFCFFAVEIAPDGSSFAPYLMDGGGSYIAMRPDGSFALAGAYVVGGYGADYAKLWEATIEPTEFGGGSYGAWIHDVAALADGSVVVIGDYTGSIILGEGEPNETVLHGVCDECIYGAFLARYAW